MLLAGGQIRAYDAIDAFRELADAIKKAREHKGGPVLIECHLTHDDYNPKMSEWGKKVSKANSRPPVHP